MECHYAISGTSDATPLTSDHVNCVVSNPPPPPLRKGYRLATAAVTKTFPFLTNLKSELPSYFLAAEGQRRCDMRHELLTQRALFCIGVNAKKGTLSQHFVTHVVPPLAEGTYTKGGLCGMVGTEQRVVTTLMSRFHQVCHNLASQALLPENTARKTAMQLSSWRDRRSGVGHLMGRDVSPQYQH